MHFELNDALESEATLPPGMAATGLAPASEPARAELQGRVPPLESDPAFRALSATRRASVLSHLSAGTTEGRALQWELHALRVSPDYRDGSPLDRQAMMRGFARVLELPPTPA